jgi:hypothetical protein
LEKITNQFFETTSPAQAQQHRYLLDDGDRLPTALLQKKTIDRSDVFYPDDDVLESVQRHHDPSAVLVRIQDGGGGHRFAMLRPSGTPYTIWSWTRLREGSNDKSIRIGTQCFILYRNFEVIVYSRPGGPGSVFSMGE